MNNVNDRQDLAFQGWSNQAETQKMIARLEAQRLKLLELAADHSLNAQFPLDQVRIFLNEAGSLKKTIKFLKGEKI